MSEVRAKPAELIGYHDDTAGMSVDAAPYGAALTTYNNASPNNLGSPGLTNHLLSVIETKGDSASLGDDAANFGRALLELDNRHVDTSNGYPEVTYTGDNDLLEVIAAAIARNQNATADVREQAIREAEAAYYVDQLEEYSDPFDIDGGDSAELAAVLALVEARAAEDPELAALVVVGLGPEDVNNLVHIIDDMTFRANYGEGDVDGRADLFDPFSNIVASATSEMSSSESQALVDGLSPHALALLAASNTWDERAANQAFEGLAGYAQDFQFAGQMSALAYDIYGGDLFVAAADSLSAYPESVYEQLTSNNELLDDFVFNDLQDGGEGGAGRDTIENFLNAGLTQYPLEAAANGDDDPLREVERILQGIVADPGGMNDGARRALAQVASLYAEDIAEVAQNGSGWGELERDDLVDFYDELFESTRAQQVAARGLGAFIAVRFDEGAADVAGTGAIDYANIDWTGFGSEAHDAGELSDLFTDALEQDGAKDAERASFWIGVGATATKAIAGAGIAAAPLSGGTSLVVGAGTAVAIGWIAGQIPVPSFDGEAAGMEAEQTIISTAAVALARHDLLDPSDFDSNPALLTELQSSGFQEALLRGDPDALSRLNLIRREIDHFDDDLLAATEQATDALAEQ